MNQLEGNVVSIRRIVSCPLCSLRFLSARAKTYCPGCHQLVEPREWEAA